MMDYPYDQNDEKGEPHEPGDAPAAGHLRRMPVRRVGRRRFAVKSMVFEGVGSHAGRTFDRRFQRVFRARRVPSLALPASRVEREICQDLSVN